MPKASTAAIKKSELTTTSGVKTGAAQASAAPASTISRIVKRVDHSDPEKDKLPRHPAGVYRVIHGTIFFPLDPSAYMKADGTRDYDKPSQEKALPGDEVNLTEDDATRMVNNDVVEPLDAKPSRVGKVWTPPKPATKVY